MSEEEKNYIIENINELIRLAKHAGVMAELGPGDEYISSIIALDKQRKQILAMDGIEDDY